MATDDASLWDELAKLGRSIERYEKLQRTVGLSPDQQSRYAQQQARYSQLEDQYNARLAARAAAHEVPVFTGDALSEWLEMNNARTVDTAMPLIERLIYRLLMDYTPADREQVADYLFGLAARIRNEQEGA